MRFATLLIFNLLLLASSGSAQNNYYGDEGYFTAPFEEIEVAAAQNGIVKQVHVQLGEEVTEGQLLVELDSTVLNANLRMLEAKANATAKIEAAKIELRTKESRFQKVSDLLTQGAARPEEVERAQADVDIAKQNVFALTEQAQIQTLEVEELESRIEQRKVKSPINGVVVELYRKRGENVAANAPLIAKVVNLNQLRVVFYLPTRTAANFSINDELKLRFPETEQSSPAKIEYVAPVTSADSGRVRVDVVINNSDGKIRSGLRCFIESERLTNQSHPTNSLRDKHIR